MEIDFKALTEATAGAVGGLLSTTLLYPLDTCKTKYQAEAKVTGQNSKYRNILDVLREAIATHRLHSLYSGLHTKNFQSVIAGFVYFYTYAYFKNQYLAKFKLKQMGMGPNLVVASLAGACTVLATQPLDTLSARMQTAEGEGETLLALVKERGLGQAYDGVGASLLLTINPAIQYTVFEQLKNKLLASAQIQSPSLLHLATPLALSAVSAFVLGAFSKTVATVITYPLIRCKVLMQRADTEEEKKLRKGGDGGAGAPKSMLQAFRIIWNGEGVGGLYKGMAAQILKTVLAAALMLMIKEKVAEGTSSVMEAVQKSVKERKVGTQTNAIGFGKGLVGKIMKLPGNSTENGAGLGSASGSGLGAGLGGGTGLGLSLDSGLVSGSAVSSGVGLSGGGLRQRLAEELGGGVGEALRGRLEPTGGAVSALM